ncbi:MAG: SurA N-terminal domain-containing protein [Nitrospirae bacterium]|nr:SurA N-terminal domain-containing protein [Nitrospirota bacterium]
MRDRITLSVFIIATVFFLFGCSRPVATVNGKKIDRKSFDQLMKERMEGHRQQNARPDMKRLKEAVLSQLIAERFMLEDAGEKKIAVTDEELNKEIEGRKKAMGEEAFSKSLRDKGISPEEFRQAVKETMILSRFTESLLNEDPVTEEELREYYRSSQIPFIRPVSMLVKMIEMDSEDAARSVIREMRSKKIAFDDMAGRLEQEKKAVIIDYGWANPDTFSPSLAEAIKNLKVGQYGGPYRGKKSFFLVMLKEREKEAIAPFEEVRESIRAQLSGQRRQAVLNRWLEQKRRSSTVVINMQ